MSRIGRVVLGVVLVAGTAGCVAPWGAYRHADPVSLASAKTGSCQEKYRETDDEIEKISEDFKLTNDDRNRWLASEQGRIDPKDKCWQAALEHHRKYDVFYLEFDDEGNATDVTQAGGVPYRDSELQLLKERLPQLLAKQPLNIVVFTHGWHGSASAKDSYSIEFKGMLLDIANGDVSLAKGRTLQSRARTSTQIEAGNATPPGSYRTVGIEVAWRGDSLDGYGLKYLNVWDRKLAADTISKGAIHDLFAFLNNFYLDNSCHGARVQAGCGAVHMLSVGHSFGALIDYQAFVGRLESGLSVDGCNRAYGFGDMTILLNPAFEGTRYRPYFNTAMNRAGYFGGESRSVCADETVDPNNVQEPTVVILQSEGDWATEWTFPILRWFSARAARTLSKEESTEQINAVGWVNEFHTHSLALADSADPTDICLSNNGPGSASSPKSYCPFASSEVAHTKPLFNRARGLVLTFDPAGLESVPPSYMPAWSVMVDKCIMQDHDDFWNPQVVRLISTLFEDSYEQSERLHGERRPVALERDANQDQHNTQGAVAGISNVEHGGKNSNGRQANACVDEKAGR